MVNKRKALVLMGSENDLPKVEPALKVFDELDVPFAVKVASAHRSPERVVSIVRTARADGFGVIITAAGGAAHLGGAVAANTTLPVVALPICVGTLGGLDALFSAVQMPGGVPMAAVGVDGAKNAGLYAAAILAVADEELAARLENHRVAQREGVERSDAKVQESLARRG